MFPWGKGNRLQISADLREVLGRAEREARNRGQPFLAPVHVVLAVLRDRKSPLCRALVASGFDLAELYRRVGSSIPSEGTTTTQGAREAEGVPWTSQTKKLLQVAQAEVSRSHDRRVAPEHLLLALLKEYFDPANLLEDEGVTLEALRTFSHEGADFRGLLQPRFKITVDDLSELPIYEQISLQVQDAVATRRLLPGQRLPPVRTLADRLSIAPGTVARAYIDLERLGVVSTNGARGTRVADRARGRHFTSSRSGALHSSVRRSVVTAFHDGATAEELREAFEAALRGIYS